MTNRKMQTFGTSGRLILIVPFLMMIQSAQYAVALIILLVMLAWLLHDQMKFVRKAHFGFGVDTAFIALLFGVPLFIGAYSELGQGRKSTAQVAAYERTFEVLCLDWRDSSWFDRNMGQYRDRRWCKDYVNRLPGSSSQAVAAETTTAVQLWK